MPEPVTIGVLAATALATAADAVVKGVVGTAAKDAYKSLKDVVARWAGRDVEALEHEPASHARRDVVAEIVDRQSANDRATVRALAEKLVASLNDLHERHPDVPKISLRVVGNIGGNLAGRDYHDNSVDRSTHAERDVIFGTPNSRPSDGG
jgi:hypothetical protein